MIEECDLCRAAAVLIVERNGRVSRRCPDHPAQGLRATARANLDGTWTVLLDAVAP